MKNSEDNYVMDWYRRYNRSVLDLKGIDLILDFFQSLGMTPLFTLW